jgi:hypothetical protein
MRRWISTLIAIALFAHSVADASGHDGHHCADCEAQELRQLLGTDNALPLSATGGRTHSEHPCHCELHSGGGCHYLPVQKLKENLLPQMFAALATTPLAELSPHTDGSLSWARGRWREFASPPLRLHLWNQLLLI